MWSVPFCVYGGVGFVLRFAASFLEVHPRHNFREIAQFK